MNKSKLSVRQMCVLALFLAIEIIMYLTPIGYLRINALSVTLMHVPVIILASTMGPAAGVVFLVSSLGGGGRGGRGGGGGGLLVMYLNLRKNTQRILQSLQVLQQLLRQYATQSWY